MKFKKAFGSPSDLHVNRALTNVAIAYTQDAATMVAQRVFPSVPVNNQSDLYYLFNRADANRDDYQLRAPATESAGITLQLSTTPYFARKWALHYDVSDEERANADEPINLDTITTENLMFKGLLRKEKLFAATYLTTGVWAVDWTGVAASPSAVQKLQWNDANSTPIEDVRDAATAMQAATGYRPNTLTLSQTVKDRLVRHPDIIDLVKYGGSNDQPAIVNETALAKVFDIERVLTMGAISNTAKEGVAESNSFIGGKSALLTYSPATPSIKLPSAGYTFNWTKYLGNSPNGIRVKNFRMEKLEADRIEGEMFFDMKLTANDLGTYFASIVA